MLEADLRVILGQVLAGLAADLVVVEVRVHAMVPTKVQDRVRQAEDQAHLQGSLFR